MRQIFEIPKEGTLQLLLNALLGAYNRRTDILAKTPIGETSIAQKLDAIIEMLRAQANVAADLALAKAELSIIHGLVVDLSADPEKAKELSERIRKQVEALQSATPKIQ